MSDNTRPQTWEIVNQEPLEVLETGSRESIDNLLDILDSKINFPFRISYESNVLTVHESEFQTYKSDKSEWGGKLDSFRVATSPIQGLYKVIGDSTLSFLDGSTTGDFASGIAGSCPSLVSGQYVWLALEATSGGKLNVSWGNPNSNLSLATYPTFASGTAVCLIKLLATASSSVGSWGTFDTVVPKDIIMFKGSGGGGSGGGTDFVPVYKSSLEFRLLSTQGRQARFNEKYFSIAEDIDFTYQSLDGHYYICLDTNQTHGIINSGNKNTYIKITQLDPNDTNFPANLVALGWYKVIGESVTQANLGVYSTREVDTIPSDLHFVPYFINSTNFGINTTQGKFVLVNGQHYGLDHDVTLSFATSLIDSTYSPSGDGTYYICLNTVSSNAPGLIPTGLETNYFVMTTIPPMTIGFNPHYAPIGQYNVVGGLVDVNSFQGYSTREIVSWVYGIPNVRRRAKTFYSSGADYFEHLLNAIPNTISYHYWDSVKGAFEELDRYGLETSFDVNRVDFVLPSSPYPWNVGDYVIVEVIYYAYTQEGGFASPKTDYSTGWYSYTPPSSIVHPLVERPKNITLEFNDKVKNTFWVEDGNQFVNKNIGGVETDKVSFDWTSLPSLSGNLLMRITMNLSKLSAGAFEATKLEKGTVAVTGNTSTAISPDIILKATDINFGNIINQSLTGNVRVLVTESITVLDQQEITVPNVSFDMLPGTFINFNRDTFSIPSIVKFSGSGYEVENIRIVVTGDTDEGLELNQAGIVKNCLIIHDGALGGKLESAVGIRLEGSSAYLATVIGRADYRNGGNIHYVLNEDNGSTTPVEGDIRPKTMITGKWTTSYRK